MDAALVPGTSGRRRDGGGGDRTAVPPVIERPACIDRASPHPAPRDQAPRVRVALAIGGVPMLSFGFRAAIDAEPDMVVVAEIDEPTDLVNRLGELAVDVAIVDAGPVPSGRSTTATIEAVRLALPSVRLVALEGGPGSEPYAIVLRAGADGVLTRDADPADVVAAIRCVQRGETYVSPSLATRMVNTYVLRRGASPTTEDAWDALSDREREVLLLAATGHTNREIAELFHLSEQTIHNCRASVMEKLGVHDRVDLLKYAIRRGVISVADL
ncbi:MAG: response regulator transcription factor [Chloroflexi bacterium]|nr:response regulator transcription factor [Chloroflexota bacterium]